MVKWWVRMALSWDDSVAQVILRKGLAFSTPRLRNRQLDRNRLNLDSGSVKIGILTHARLDRDSSAGRFAVIVRFPFLVAAVALLVSLAAARAGAPVDLGPVTEKHVMVPMRDGTKLSVYLYFPPGQGPWPVLYEQRYADLRGAATRQSYARLAAAGYVVAAENFRGTHLSEGTWVGYRAVGWGEQQDGYDTVEWLARQPWSTGKVGTLGSSQGGFAQNFLAVARPPHLVCQYMIDTGLSLFHEGYRIG